ncbi:MAG: cation:proton antiporter subunit C [Cryobacterium sp.]
MTLAISAGILVAGAVYLFLQRGMLRIIFGFILLSHGVNLILMAAGGTDRRAEPLGTELDASLVADPLPQAFVLTAIVIAFSITIVMLVLAVTGKTDDDTGDDDGDDDGDDEDHTPETRAVDAADHGVREAGRADAVPAATDALTGTAAQR